MGAIGKPKRKVEYWPLETPVPTRRSAPNEPATPLKTTPVREPVPTQR
jgi:hypothetical protein